MKTTTQRYQSTLRMAAQRFEDLAEVIREQGPYSDHGFLDATARRIRGALPPKRVFKPQQTHGTRAHDKPFPRPKQSWRIRFTYTPFYSRKADSKNAVGEFAIHGGEFKRMVVMLDDHGDHIPWRRVLAWTKEP